MTDNMQTSAILSAGMKLLRENLGLIETEIFIVGVKNKGFDYTEWRENLWEDMTTEELFAKAAEFERQHPELIPKNAQII
jgi:hypothetical protein